MSERNSLVIFPLSLAVSSHVWRWIALDLASCGHPFHDGAMTRFTVPGLSLSAVYSLQYAPNTSQCRYLPVVLI